MRWQHAYESRRRPKEYVIHGESTSKRIIDQGRIRIVCVIMVFALSYAALAIRVLEVSLMPVGAIPFKQLVTNPQLLLSSDGETEKVIAAQQKELKVRHAIVDRRGNVLADNIRTASLVANPQLIRDKEWVITQLHRILPELSKEVLLNSLSRESKFSYIKRHLTPEEQEKVNALGVAGLFFEPDSKRVYPYGDILAHVLGYVGIDNQGLSGVEKYFDETLSSPYADEALALSIDVSAQTVVHEELQAAMKEFKAIGATAVLADIHNGEVIALSSLPSFNPNRPSDASEQAMFNRATLGVYEMGSTFKTFTVAMGLHHEVITPYQGYDISDPIRVAGYTINDHHPMKGWHSVADIFAQSSNIGTVKIAMDVGAEKQQSFLKKLGLFEPVTIELPERANPMTPKKWRDISMMTVSYGHGISVSPLHMVKAIGTLVRGGESLSLTLQKTEKASVKGERIISEEASRNISKMLRMVVEEGTASKANVKGYRVGGKTGTAEKFKNGSYQHKDMVTSFVSVFPTDQPKYVLVTMLDEPRGTKKTFGYATAGWTAVPTAGKIIERVAPLLGVQPIIEIEPEKKEPFQMVRQTEKQPATRPQQAQLIQATLRGDYEPR